MSWMSLAVRKEAWVDVEGKKGMGRCDFSGILLLSVSFSRLKGNEGDFFPLSGRGAV